MPRPGPAHTPTVLPSHGWTADIDRGITLSDDNIKETTRSPASCVAVLCLAIAAGVTPNWTFWTVAGQQEQ